MRTEQQYGYYTTNEVGQFHSFDDEPAIVVSTHTDVKNEGDIETETIVEGYQAWYLNGNLHRENNPAVIRDNGKLFFYENGNFIREE